MIEELIRLQQRAKYERLGQLIYNAVNMYMVENKIFASESEIARFIFYCPDDKLTHIIRAWVDDNFPVSDLPQPT